MFFILKEAIRFADFSVLEIAFQLVPSPSDMWSFEYLLQLEWPDWEKSKVVFGFLLPSLLMLLFNCCHFTCSQGFSRKLEKVCVNSLWLGKDVLPTPADRIWASERRSDTSDTHLHFFWIYQSNSVTHQLSPSEVIKKVCSGGEDWCRSGVEETD